MDERMTGFNIRLIGVSEEEHEEDGWPAILKK